MKIRAAVTRAPKKPASLEELSLEEPRSNEVMVRVVAAGVCHTDIAMRDQVYPVPQPIVLGHEGAGVVEAVGSVLLTALICGWGPITARAQTTTVFPANLAADHIGQYATVESAVAKVFTSKTGNT
jgi:hypothetical protein